jgi:pimeloyl-ACP methyl ester carboxylesterase
MSDTVVMELPDGRELAWLEMGDPEGPAVFHGTPGSRLQVSIDEGPISAAKVRFVAVDRPGYGHSTFQQDRRLADWGLDVSCLADHLNIDKFSVVGISGGGPHAAACARFLPDRVMSAGIVSGVAPLFETGSEKGMMGLNKAIVRLARRSQYLVYPPLAFSGYISRRWPEMALRAAPRQLPACDVDVLNRPKVKSAFMEDSRRSSSTSAMAAAQDFSLIATDWGFRLEGITRPVDIWHGDEDRNVPFCHGRLQADRIPGARMHECPGEGHLLVVDHLKEILRTVVGEGS